jgi:hypothetical protein
MRLVVVLLVGSVGALFLAGCKEVSPKAEPPPFKVSFRKSQIPGQGMVANVNNPSSTEPIKLTVVFVKGKEEKEERSYRLDRKVEPLDSLSVGWSQLKGWKLKPGDTIRIRCDGYTDDLTCEVTKPTT